LTKLLTIDRLKTFSESVLLVAITVLAYNLSPPSLINGKLSGVELQSFLDNVYGLISSFSAISVFWLLYTKILDYMKEVDDVVILLSLIFFILVLLIPVFSLAQFQYRNLQSVISLALLQIINGLLLLSILTYIIKHLNTCDTKRRFGSNTSSSRWTRSFIFNANLKIKEGLKGVSKGYTFTSCIIHQTNIVREYIIKTVY